MPTGKRLKIFIFNCLKSIFGIYLSYGSKFILVNFLILFSINSFGRNPGIQMNHQHPLDTIYTDTSSQHKKNISIISSNSTKNFKIIYVYDTIVVYDTVVVYDTILVYDKQVKSIIKIKKDKEKAPLSVDNQNTNKGILHFRTGFSWSADVYSIIGATRHILTTNKIEQPYIDRINLKEKYETPLSSYVAGVNFTGVKKNWLLQIGITYWQQNEKVNYKFTDSVSLPNADSTKKTKSFQSKNTYTYIEFPLIVGYKCITKNKFICYIKGGAFIDCFVNAKGKVLSFDLSNKIVDVSQLPFLNYNISALVSIEMVYNLTKKLSLFADPFILESLFPSFKNYTISMKYRTIGLNIGLRCKL